jgi:hypothetical protein
VDVLSFGLTPGFMETIVRQRAAQLTDTDGLLLPQRDWANLDDLDELQVIGVAVQPVTSGESRASDTRAVTTQWVLITPPRRGDVDVQRGDRLVVGARTFEVVADPDRWPAVTGGIDHVEAILEAAPPWAGAGGDTLDGHLQAATQGASTGQGWRP